jgi:hypothetical protein
MSIVNWISAWIQSLTFGITLTVYGWEVEVDTFIE